MLHVLCWVCEGWSGKKGGRVLTSYYKMKEQVTAATRRSRRKNLEKKLYFLNYNGSWEGFFKWSAFYGVSDSFVDYPYGSVYLFSSLTFSSFHSILVIFLPAFFKFLFSLTYITYIIAIFIIVIKIEIKMSSVSSFPALANCRFRLLI